MGKAKESILQKIRKANEERVYLTSDDLDWDTQVYKKDDLSLVERFVKELSALKGQVFHCKNHNDLIEQLQELIQEEGLSSIYISDVLTEEYPDLVKIPGSSNQYHENTKAAVFACESAIARTGSVLVLANSSEGRQGYIIAEHQIIIVRQNQVVYDVSDALNQLQQSHSGKLPSMISVISGPSRTADIEKTLILGAHGPKKVSVFLI